MGIGLLIAPLFALCLSIRDLLHGVVGQMKFNGTLLDRRSAGKSSRLNATIKVYEPDETGTDNPRIYTFPMDNPYLDVTIEKVPDQMNHWKQTMREWVRVRTTKP